jgi:hypothetical protein
VKAHDITMIDSSRRYAAPLDVIRDARLDLMQKLSVLERWQTETLKLPPSDAESAAGGARNRLSEILRAKQALLEGGAAPNESPKPRN